MGIHQTKAVSYLPPIGNSKAVEAATGATTTAPTDTAFQDTFSFIASHSTPDTTNLPNDPFGNLRAALESAAPASDGSDQPVPTAEEIVAADPTLNSIADGSVLQQFEDLRLAHTTQKLKFEDQVAQGALAPREIKQLEVKIDQLSAKIVAIEEEEGRIREISKQAHATYDKELTLVAQFGKTDPQKCDLNGDGKVGAPQGTHYVIGTREINGDKQFALLDSTTMKPVRFDKQGNALDGNALNTKYTWDLSKSGLTSVSGQSDSTGSDLVVQGSPEYLGMRHSYPGSSNTYNVNMDIPVPESFWVETYADGTAKIVDGRYVLYKPQGGLGLTSAAPPEAIRKKYLQVKVGAVNATSVDSEPPIGWPAGQPWDAQNFDGYDQLVQFKDATGNILCQMRIVGTPADKASKTTVDSTDHNGTHAISLAHNGYIAASTLSLAFSAGGGFDDADHMRQSPIALEFEQGYKSTGTLAQFAKDGQLTNETFGEPGEKGADTLKAFNNANANLSYGYIGKSMAREWLSGGIVAGLSGNFTSHQYNNVFDVAPPADDVHQTDPLYTTTIDAGNGFNAVFSKQNNLYAQGVTYLDKEGHDGDITNVKTNGGVTWDNYGSSNGALVKQRWGDNPAVYIKVHTPNGQTNIDNSADLMADGLDGVTDHSSYKKEEGLNHDNAGIPEPDTSFMAYEDEVPRPSPFSDGPHTETGSSLQSPEKQWMSNYSMWAAQKLGEWNAKVNSAPLMSDRRNNDDNYQDITTGTLSMTDTTTESKDSRSDAQQIDANDMQKSFGDARKKLEDALASTPADANMGQQLETETWKEYGPVYNNAQASMTGFFAEYRKAAGLPELTPTAKDTTDNIDAEFTGAQ